MSECKVISIELHAYPVSFSEWQNTNVLEIQFSLK